VAGLGVRGGLLGWLRGGGLLASVALQGDPIAHDCPAEFVEVVPVGARAAAATKGLAGVGLVVVVLDRLPPPVGFVVTGTAGREGAQVLRDVEGGGAVGDRPGQLLDLDRCGALRLTCAAGDVPGEVEAVTGLVVPEPDGGVGTGRRTASTTVLLVRSLRTASRTVLKPTTGPDPVR
jgi:hypothetical protein